MATYRQILDEVRKPGVWQTKTGKWAGKRPDGSTQYGMSSKDTAKAYVAGKDVEGGEDKPSEKEPSKVKQNPKRTVGGKDKTLSKVDTSNSEFYNEDINPPDSKYKTPKGFEAGPPPEPFKFPEESKIFLLFSILPSYFP